MKLITLGSGYTGSSAIEDYLSGRGDVFLKTKTEFRLIQDPGGLLDLRDAICGNFHINRANAAISAFEILCDRMGRDKKSYPKGLSYRKIFSDYDVKCKEFIRNITLVSYPGMSASERMSLSLFQQKKYNFLKKIATIRKKKPLIGNIRLPVNKNLFYNAAFEFIDSLFQDERNPDNKMPMLLPQAGSFWSPISSTIWFGEKRKILFVTRDPRDIFSDIQNKGFAYPGNDVHVFVKWFSGMMQHVNEVELNSEKIVRIKFEEFVLEYDKVKSILDINLNLNPELTSSYDPELSKKNIGIYKKVLKKSEIETIESKLTKYLQY